MKTIYLILAIALISCFSAKNSMQNNETYYFYFDAGKETMKKYYSSKNGPLNYLYRLDTENVIFTPKNKETRNNPERIKISPNDTSKLNIKYFHWLNHFTNIERDSFFLRKSNRKFFVLEKDTLDNELYLIDVIFIQEIE